MIRKSIVLLIAIFMFATSSAFCFADSSAYIDKSLNQIEMSQDVKIERLADDAYYRITTTIYENKDSAVSVMAAMKTRSASVTYDYILSGVKRWSYTLNGTFQYDGATAKATASSCSSSISDSSWSCISKTSSYSGAITKGTGNFKSGTILKSVDLKLTCSPSGTIS